MLNAKQLNQKIAGVRKSAKAVRENIQVVLVNATAHAYEHGDVTFFTKLFDATIGVDRKAITKWAHEYAPVRLTEKGFRLNKAKRAAMDFATGEEVVEYLSDSENCPNWWEAVDSAEQVARALDVSSRLESLAKSIDKAVAEGNVVKLGGLKESLALLNASINRATDKAA